MTNPKANEEERRLQLEADMNKFVQRANEFAPGAFTNPKANEQEVNSQLTREIAEVLNRLSRENASNTPDHVLAAYLVACLEAYEDAVRERER